MQADSLKELEERIAELKRRIPPHSVPPAMIQELEELEEQLEKAREAEKKDVDTRGEGAKEAYAKPRMCSGGQLK